MVLQMGLVKGFFSHFHPKEKSAKIGPRSGSELLPESSPSTPAAHVDVLSGVELLAKFQQLSDQVGDLERRYSHNVEVVSSDITWLYRLITEARHRLQQLEAWGEEVTGDDDGPGVTETGCSGWSRHCDHAAAVPAVRRVPAACRPWYAQCALCSRPWRSHRYSSGDGCRGACCCATTGVLVGWRRKLWSLRSCISCGRRPVLGQGCCARWCNDCRPRNAWFASRVAFGRIL